MSANDEGFVEVQDNSEEERIAAKIVMYLEVYPMISPTMLQVALGPQVKPAIWRPVLDNMVDNEIVIRDTVSHARENGLRRDFIRIYLKK